jgi:hypothetical protein
MKLIAIYKSKLSSILPQDLMPRISQNSTAKDKQLYLELLRDSYCKLTYRRELSKNKAIKLILKMYDVKYIHTINYKQYIQIFPKIINNYLL